MLILGLTSSTASVGVAIAADGHVLASRQAKTDRRHAEEITPMIEAVLASAGVSIRTIDRLAVDVGPGRFTGLRVGLATARGLALALDRPVVGVSSLELLGAAHDERPLVAVIDARRNEVFQQTFGSDGTVSDAIVGNPAELGSALPRGAIVVGDGADRYAEYYGDSVLPGRDPLAEQLVRLAAYRPALAGHLVEPLYLRDPDVQVNIKTRLTPVVPRRRRGTAGKGKGAV
ncbi:MAG: tRNA threonylcarbamoyladenosine biosynthesis protein TsaB [Acidimicrobiales bacterium]